MLKLIKKTIEAFGYKILDKKLYKNQRLVSQNSILTISHFLKKYFDDTKLKNISTCPKALTKDAWIKVKAKNHDNVAKKPVSPAKQLSNLLFLNFLNSDLS